MLVARPEPAAAAEPRASIELSPRDQARYENTFATVWATVTDANGGPVAGAQIQFAVVGVDVPSSSSPPFPNMSAGNPGKLATTDAAGRAWLTWSRSGPGMDTVTALALIDGVVVAAGEAEVTWVSRSLPAPGVDDPPFTQGEHSGTGFASPPSSWRVNYSIFPGRDASCGPDRAGNGWVCVPEIPHVIAYDARHQVGPDVTAAAVELFVRRPGTTTPVLVATHNSPCAGTSVVCDMSGSVDSFEAGEWLVRDSYSWGAAGYMTPILSMCCSVGPIKRLPEIVNRPPVLRFAPAQATSWHRAGPADWAQSWVVTADDPEGHNWTAELVVISPSGIVRTDRFADQTVRSGGYATSQPIQLPRENGIYRVRARATDTSRTGTAAGAWTETTFNYVWNEPGPAPTQDTPTRDAQINEGDPIAFTIHATDPELDTYTGEVTIRRDDDGRTSTVTTSQSASGGPSTGVLADGLLAGRYQWRAIARDAQGLPGALSGWSAIEVVTGSAPYGNEPPGVPALVAPTAAEQLAAAGPQLHTIAAADPDGDRYSGVVEVRDAASLATVRTFATNSADSGAASSGSPVPLLGPGAYEWRARAVDGRGAVGDPSLWRSYRVVDTGSFPSDACAGGPSGVAVWSGTVYGGLAVKGSEACVRLDGAVQFGARVTVAGPGGGGAPATVTFDADTAACAASPTLSGVVGAPGDPWYAPYRVEIESRADGVWVCVDVGDQHHRLTLTLPNPPQPPAVAIAYDPPGPHAPVPVTPPGLASSTCTGQAGATTILQVDADGTQTWLRVWQETATRVHVCAGTRGPVNGGGRLTVDTTATPGRIPSITTGGDFPCTRNIASNDQTGIRVARTPDNANPASVCAAVGGTALRVSVDTTADPHAPVVTWTADTA